MKRGKTVQSVSGECCLSGLPVVGYEIHVGDTTGVDRERPLFTLAGRSEGAQSVNGRVSGTYLHGMFSSDAFRSDWLGRISTAELKAYNYQASVEVALDVLADHVEESVDVSSRSLGPSLFQPPTAFSSSVPVPVSACELCNSQAHAGKRRVNRLAEARLTVLKSAGLPKHQVHQRSGMRDSRSGNGKP